MERTDNKLTPSKIMRLLQLAESATPQLLQAGAARIRRRVLAEKNTIEATAEHESVLGNSGGEHSKHNTPCESTGILDLDQCEGFGESCEIGDNLTTNLVGMSISTNSFHAGEMTGRSTGTTDVDEAISRVRQSAAIDELAARMMKQSSDVANIVRQSVCNNYSFVPAQPDLSSDELSFVREHGELPVLPSQLNMNLTRIGRLTNITADTSVGSYFMKGSQNLADIIGRSESPQYDNSVAASLVEGDSRMYGLQPGYATINDSDCVVLDNTLDHVPTRQPRPGAPAVLRPPLPQHLQSKPEDASAMDTSLSISLIAKCLGKCDNDVTPSMLLAEAKIKKKPPKPELPMREKNVGNQKDTFTIVNPSRSRPVPAYSENPHFVATLRTAGKTETASSASSVTTVISNAENKENIEKQTINKDVENKSARGIDNRLSAREDNLSVVDLEDSVSIVSNSLSQCVNIDIQPVEGYVGVCTTAIVKLTSQSDSFISALLNLIGTDPNNEDFAIEIPRLPILLKPQSYGLFSLSVTALKPFCRPIKLVLKLQDTSTDVVDEKDLELNVKFTIPNVDCVTNDDEGVTFPPTSLESETVASFVLTTDCEKPLQLSLSVAQNTKTFSIGGIHEIKMENVKRYVSEQHTHRPMNDGISGMKYKALRHNFKQVCVLSKGSALRVVMLCKAPSSIVTNTPRTTISSRIDIQLVGTNTLIHRIPMSATIGVVKLAFHTGGEKLLLTKEKQTLEVKNVGTISGSWRTSIRGALTQVASVSPGLLEITSGASASLLITHAKQPPAMNGYLVLQNIYDGNVIEIELVTAVERFATFPIRTTHCELAWVKEGRKEISLKNTSNYKLAFKCKIYGDAFHVENAKESGGELLLELEPNECCGLSVMYRPREKGCHNGKIAITLEQDTSCVKSVRLNGHSSGASGCLVRWATGVITCGQIAIVFARRRQPVTLALENRSREPAFYSAKMLFNMQYRSLTATSQVSPPRGVIAPHGSVQLSIELDWNRLERLGDAGSTLASLFVLVGPEVSRRRILRILKNEDVPDGSTSPAEELSRLKGTFVGEDPRIDALIKDFDETKKSLPILTSSIQELTAQIELNRDSAERTILLTDDTCIEHHTLLD